MTNPLHTVIRTLQATCLAALVSLQAAAIGQVPPFSKLLPGGIVVDAAANRVSWSNAIPPGSVEIVDNATHVHRSVAIIRPQFAGLDASTGHLFVPSIAQRSTLIVIDMARAAIAAVVLLADGQATHALVDSRARKVYVLQEKRVAVVDADSLTVEYVDLSSEAYQAVVDARNARLYVTTSDGLTVFAIDAVSRAVTTIAIPAPPTLNSVWATITLNAVTNEALVLAGGGATLAIVDGATYQVTTIPVPGVANRAMAVDTTTGKVYIPNPPASSLTIVDTLTRELASVPLPAMPNRIAINESNGKIYVGALNRGVLVIDRATLGHSMIAAGSNPGEVTLDIDRDLAYFGDTASVLVVDGNIATPISAASYGMAVEFHRPDLDHYVVTTNRDEIGKLESLAKWVRTGATFGTLLSTGGATPVCRFYLPPGLGDSHLMMASTAECAATAARHPTFVYESPDVFRVALPDPVTGACTTGLVPVYRLWNQRRDSNHRYVVDVTTRDAMVTAGFVVEGFGPGAAGICVPRPATYTLP